MGGTYAYQCVKVKCTLVQAPRLCTGRTAHRGSRGIALLFLDHDTRRGWGVSVKPRPLFTPGKDPVLIVQEAGWALGPVWTGAENFTPTGIRFHDRPARIQSLYRLRYPAYITVWWMMKGVFAARTHGKCEAVLNLGDVTVKLACFRILKRLVRPIPGL
jgi:hypothetical protein